MASRSTRSISLPIVLSSVAVALTGALLVGWIVVVVKNLELTQQYVQNTWLLIIGILSFAAIITVLVLFSVFLAREILEVRRQTSFIDSVTHELRSPLASLKLCLETLARSELAEDQRENLREMMLADVERLSAFIEDILHANRLGHGYVSRGVSRVVLAETVDTCVATVAKRHKITRDGIVVDVPANLELSADPVALEMVLKNLIDNAAKYSEPPRDICVWARVQPGGRVAIEVRDKGVGIPKRALSRILERFYRVDDEAVRARPGTGLGLFVVSATLRPLRGKLKVESDGPGLGTTVRVELPLDAKVAKGDKPRQVEQKAYG